MPWHFDTVRSAGLLLLASAFAWSPQSAGAQPSTPDPAFKQQGWWSTPQSTDGVDAIHMVLLRGTDDPTYGSQSQILFWSSGGDARLWRWNPGDTLSSTTEFDTVPTDDSEIFCAGHNALSDGRILVTGGTEPSPGLDHVNILDPTVTPPSGSMWIAPRPENMYQSRWYPTNTILGDGRVVVVAGLKYNEMLLFGGEDDVSLNADLAVFGLRGIPWEDTTEVTATGPDSLFGHTFTIDPPLPAARSVRPIGSSCSAVARSRDRPTRSGS
jgi:hypothetical protein